MRLPEGPTVRDGGISVQKLQRGDGDEALADRLLVGVADRPWLVESRELPLGVGHDPAVLVREVDARRRSEAEHARVLRDRVRTHPANVGGKWGPASQRVEV